MKIIKIYLTGLLLVSPLILSAAFRDTRGLILDATSIIDYLLTLAVGLSVLAFFWGLAKFIFRVGGDEKAVADGKRIMQWGIISFFVMISILGIVAFIQSELGIDKYIPKDNQIETEQFVPKGQVQI